VAIDSNSIKIDKEEFKFIINSFNELKACKELYNIQLTKEKIYLNIITDKDSIIQLKDKIILNLSNQIKLIQPKWYDKFYIGAAAGIGLSIIIFILAK